MTILIQRSVVEQFNFNGQNVRSVHVKNVGVCLVSSDVYRAVGYNRKAGIKAINRNVPEKHKMRYQDVKADLQTVPGSGDGLEKSRFPLPDAVLLKEPGLYCFLLRCGREEAEPFMEWAVETVLPREVRKLSKQLSDQQQSIEKQDLALALINNDLTMLEQENLKLQDQVEVLRHQSVPCLADVKKNNGLAVIQKNNGDEFPYMTICGQQGYVTQKIQNKLTDYPNGQLVILAETPNAIVHYNWLRERGCVVANPDSVRHFRLGENYTHQRLMELREA
jgi:prophage antirepressor-like protein